MITSYGFRAVARMEWRKLLIGLGAGAFIRHTAGAICALAGVLFVLPVLFVPLGPSAQNLVAPRP